MRRCLQEISYLTSPQAMNPLPNRPIIANPSVTMAIPNVPSFESMPYNGRPRKLLPEAGKDFPILNGMNNQVPNASHPQNAEQNGNLIQQQNAALTSGSQLPAPSQQQQTLDQRSEGGLADKEAEQENSGTAIFRPGEDWKEKLRQSHEAAKNRAADQPESSSDGAGWVEDGELKEDETGIEDEDSAVEGEGVKTWKPKKTLRK